MRLLALCIGWSALVVASELGATSLGALLAGFVIGALALMLARLIEAVEQAAKSSEEIAAHAAEVATHAAAMSNVAWCQLALATGHVRLSDLVQVDVPDAPPEDL